MKILWFVSTIEDTRFLNEFAKNFRGTIDVFHLNFITRISMLGFRGRHFYPVSPTEYRNTEVCVAHTFNVLSGRLTESEAKAAYASTTYVLDTNSEYLKDTIFFIPSGRHVHHVAAREYSDRKNLDCVYINYSNFPGYTFFDPKGTDCLSSIYNKPNRLDDLYPNAVDVCSVFEKFSRLKEQQTSIPQAANVGVSKKLKSTAFIFDSLIQKLFRFYGDRRVRFNTKNMTEDISIEYDELSSIKDDYFFFPLQVSTDQQVLVNYDGGSIYKAIDEAIKVAERKQRVLVIREHPAESMVSNIRNYLIKKRQRYNCLKVVDVPVHKLIDDCESVITINSTVGLESRLMHKKVIFLGRSFYEKATDQQLAKYLDRYFVSVDYHHPKLNSVTVSEILKYKHE